MNLLPPGTLLGAFEILSPLGRGGMGAVYKARNRITGDERAVKLMLPELAARTEFVERFVREIRMAMSVEHANLVRVFEPGMDGDRIFLPMELLVGESLSERLKRDGMMPPEESLIVIECVGAALAALHTKGILHRDVKPSNVFLTSGPAGALVPKLLDLGAGKDVEGSDEATATGLAVGSPHYMAPEQASGQKDLDARVDQYALAVLAYQLLTGARPYENDDSGHVLAKVLSGASFKTPRQIRETISPQLDDVVLKAMSRRREHRFATLEEFVGAVRAAWPGGAPPPATEESTRFAPLVEPPVPMRAPAPMSATMPMGAVGSAPVAQDRSGTMQVSTVNVQGTNAKPAVLGVLMGLVVVGVIAAAWAFVGHPGFATRAPAVDPGLSTFTAPRPKPTAAAPAVASSVAAVPDAPPAPAAPPPAAVPQTVPDPLPAPPPSVSAAPVPPPAPRPAVGRPSSPRPASRPDPGSEPCHPTPGAPCL